MQNKDLYIDFLFKQMRLYKILLSEVELNGDIINTEYIIEKHIHKINEIQQFNNEIVNFLKNEEIIYKKRNCNKNKRKNNLKYISLQDNKKLCC